MPISQFSEGLQKALSLLPGTYGTSLTRNHALRGAFVEMENAGLPAQVINGMRDGIDCNIYFFGEQVEIGAMYAYLAGATLLLIVAYVLLNVLKNKKR